MKNIDRKYKYICVHDDAFHADDVYAIALAKLMLLDGHCKIVRTRNYEKFKDASYVIDVGGKFDDVKFFDHHQHDCPTYKDGTKKAACSLLWDHFGLPYLCDVFGNGAKAEFVSDKMDKFFKGISNWDNGDQIRGNVMNVSEEIRMLNSSNLNDTETQNRVFLELANMKKQILRRMIEKYGESYENQKIIKTAIASSEKPVLVLPRGGLPLSDVDTDGFTCCCYPKTTGMAISEWNIQAINDIKSNGYRQNRSLSDIRSIVERQQIDGFDVIFAHASGFLCSIKGREEDAVAFALKHFKAVE